MIHFYALNVPLKINFTAGFLMTSREDTMELSELRTQLDGIDAKLVAITELRLQICEQIAEYKIANNKPVLDAEREQQKIAIVRAMTAENRYRDAVEHLFVQIMSDSRELQTAIMAEHQEEQNDRA